MKFGDMDTRATEREESEGNESMIIDVHGHYTTAPRSVSEWRQKQIAAFPEPYNEPFVITNDEIVETITTGQLTLQQDRGTDAALFSPTAGRVAQHDGEV